MSETSSLVGPAIPDTGRASRSRLRAVTGATVLVAAMTLLALGQPTRAAESTPISAAAGAALAREAARVWAADAELVYVENDEPLDPAGVAGRWGYLFRSPSLARSRGYSVTAEKVVQAADLGVRFEAPPVGVWVDSDRALLSAEEDCGAEFRTKEGGELAHMVLIRSATDPKHPERTCWLVVYRAAGRPSLFVLVDAESGKVDRTWRG